MQTFKYVPQKREFSFSLHEGTQAHTWRIHSENSYSLHEALHKLAQITYMLLNGLLQTPVPPNENWHN